MLRQNRAGTISALLIGLLVLVVCLSSLGTHASAIARLQSGTPTLTPCNDDVDDGTCSDYRLDLTATAESATQTATAMGTSNAGTSTATGTITPGVGTPTVTRTPTRSPTGLPVAAPLIPSPVQLTPIPEPQRLAPTETPTMVPDSALTCFPGQPLVITGNGPARAAFLVYFGQRIVSGGSVSPSGRFTKTLLIGSERAGVYSITVRVRGTNKVLLVLFPAFKPAVITQVRQEVRRLRPHELPD